MILIQPASLKEVEGFWQVLDAVARERQYLLMTQAYSLESTTHFVADLLDKGDIQFYALDGAKVVGWCDIIRNQQEQMKHVGRMGMGLLADYRGQGIGSRLLSATMQAAFDKGIQRIELAAFDSNERAIRMYKKLGFQEEGRNKYAYSIDGQYRDFIMMAYYRIPAVSPYHP